MTVSGSLLGTPAYMSPEQIATGRVKLDHRTDVYSLGTVLYEILAQRRPFPGDSREAVLSGILTKDPRPPRRFNPRVPLDLETIALKAMEKDPDRRYATAAAMAHDLRQHLHGGLIAARRAGPLRRTIKLVRRRPAAAVAVVATVLVIGLVGFASRMSTGRSAEAALRSVAEARYHLSRGEYRNGLFAIESALAGGADSSEAHLIHSRVLLKLNRYEEALAEGRSLLEQDADDWTGHLILAMVAREPTLSGDPGISAEEHLRQVDAHAPETADAWFVRALATTSDSEAILLLDRALEVEPDHAGALYERSTRHQHTKDFSAALRDAERLALVRPRSAEGLRQVADIHHTLHDSRRALREYDRALALDPDDAVTYWWRAFCYLDLDRRDEALADMTRAIELDPDNHVHYANRAWQHWWRQDYEAMIADAQRAVDLQPGNLTAQRALFRAYNALGRTEDSRALIDDLLARSANWVDAESRSEVHQHASESHLMAGDYDAAVREAERSLQLDPAPETYFTVIYTRQSAGDDRGAKEDCETFTGLDLVNPDDLLTRAATMLNLCDNTNQALDDYNRAIRLAPGWPDPYFRRSRHHARFGTAEQALADLGTALELAPGWGEAYFDRGKLNKKLRRYEDALADYEKAGAQGHDDLRVDSERARILIMLGREDDALAIQDQVIERTRGSGRAYRGRAEILLLIGRIDRALNDVQRAMEINPKSPWGYRLRAHLASFEPGNCDPILEDAARAEDLGKPGAWSTLLRTRIAPACPSAFDATVVDLARDDAAGAPGTGFFQTALGWALYRSGEHEEALAVLSRALEVDPDNDVEVLFGLAMAHWQTGDRALARAHFDEAVSRLSRTYPKHPLYLRLRDEASALFGS